MSRTIFLIRHAKAGDRGSHGPKDLDRPLSKKGTRQAEALVQVFEAHQVEAIYSSPATRCVQTVEPLARSIGLEVQLLQSAVEGSRIQLPDSMGDIVICAHGDNIPDFIGRLGGAAYRCSKASIWEVTEDDKGGLRCGAYQEAPNGEEEV